MESLSTSHLMNDPDLDSWNPEHNPLLEPASMISSSLENNGHMKGGHFVEMNACSEGMDVLGVKNKTMDSPFANSWREENHNGVDFADFSSSSPTWLEGGNDNHSSLHRKSSVDDLCFHSEIHSPSSINKVDYSHSLSPGRISGQLLTGDILEASTCKLYSSLKDISFLDSAESATALPLESGIGEMEDTDHFSSLQEECSDLWRAVGVIETRRDGEPDTTFGKGDTTFSKTEPLSGSNVLHPLYADSRLVQTDQAHVTNSINMNHPTPSSIYSQSRGALNASNVPYNFNNSVTPLGWPHRPAAHYHMKNQIRFRKSKCRKPMLRNFNSNFFRLPVQSNSQSPQLKMVKLFRSNGGEEDPIDQDDISFVPDRTASLMKETTPLGLGPVDDNPELALMKTVDMPSGKRMEDIYVVPSVWISGKESDSSVVVGSNKSHLDSCSKIPQGTKKAGSHPKGCHLGMKGLRNEVSEDCQNAGFPSMTSSGILSPSCYNITSTATTLSTVAKMHGRQEEGGSHSRRNIIITTLNVPKIDTIPCLRDLCKAVLKDHPLSQHKHIQKLPMPQQSSSSPVVNTDASSESEINNVDKSYSHITYVKEPTIPNCGGSPNYEAVKSKTNELLNSDSSIGASCLNKPVDLMNSTSCPSLLKLDNCNSPENSGQHPYIVKEQISCSISKNDIRHSPLTVTSNDNSTSTLKGYGDDEILPSFDCFHHEASDPTVTFASSLTHMSTSCESVHSNYENIIEGLNEPALAVSSMPEASSSSSFIDSPFPCEIEEDDATNNPPELASLMKQIQEMHTSDPTNKPLANLSTTLHLLHDAEKTLCNANFGVYHQLKMGQHSKFGQLIRCILSLTGTVVVMGKSLCEWTGSSTDHQCLKTVEILANLYQTNIINLIELITPYFHYVCSLIASCHADILQLNKVKTSTGTSPAHPVGSQSFSAFCPQEPGRSKVLADVTSSHHNANNYEQLYAPGALMKNVSDPNSFCQNNPGYAKSEDDFFGKRYAVSTNLSHNTSGRLPDPKNHPKKAKVSLLKEGLSVATNGPRNLHSRKTDPKMSSYYKDLKHPAVKRSQAAAKAILVNVSSNRVLHTVKSPMPVQSQALQPSGLSQQRPLHQQHVLSPLQSPTVNRASSTLLFRAPPRDATAKAHQASDVLTGYRPFRVHDHSPCAPGVFTSSKVSDRK